MLAIIVGGDRNLGGELRVRSGLGPDVGGLVGARARLIRVREVPVADRVRLTDIESPMRMLERRLGEAEHRVYTRHQPLTAGEVLRLASGASPQWKRDAWAACSMRSSSSRVSIRRQTSLKRSTPSCRWSIVKQ
jgi:hypothetical protein